MPTQLTGTTSTLHNIAGRLNRHSTGHSVPQVFHPIGTPARRPAARKAEWFSTQFTPWLAANPHTAPGEPPSHTPVTVSGNASKPANRLIRAMVLKSSKPASAPV